MPRLLQHHDRLLARPNRRHLRRLLYRPMPAHRWQSEIDRGMLVPKEVGVGHGRRRFAKIEDGTKREFF